MAMKKGGLGRGLDSLFSENSTENESVIAVKITDIEPNKNQPRKDFDEEALNELADSISKHGLIQPIAVRPTANGTYSIIAGERRWRACRIAGLSDIPVVIKDIDEKSVMELALIENLQREDLNAVEEALGYKTLLESYSLTQEEIAESVGKSRSSITNSLRLLNLNDDELDALRKGLISAGHARALLALNDEKTRKVALEMAIKGCSVRQIENLAKQTKQPTKKTTSLKDTYFKEVEIALKEELGRKVTVKPNGKKGGTITLEFLDKKELEQIVNNLTK